MSEATLTLALLLSGALNAWQALKLTAAMRALRDAGEIITAYRRESDKARTESMDLGDG